MSCWTLLLPLIIILGVTAGLDIGRCLSLSSFHIALTSFGLVHSQIALFHWELAIPKGTRDRVFLLNPGDIVFMSAAITCDKFTVCAHHHLAKVN